MNDLVIIGASGHGKVIADIACRVGYTNIVFLDDNENAKKCGEYEVVGGTQKAREYAGADFIVAIGNAIIRRRFQEEIEAYGLNPVSLVHPAAVIAQSSALGKGCVVMAGAVINPYVTIGKGCIINTCASVDHDCVIEDYVHVSVGAHIAGTVTVGENTWIGAGVIVSNNVRIVSDCMIGAGAVVVSDIKESATYIGVPAKKMIK